ncbi:hypothetical protein JF66_02010 [Cryobacterium sp. MLB-32]|nr:hypothetical protein JF66_02010 [Cryobacterium sp. MLB-32]
MGLVASSTLVLALTFLPTGGDARRGEGADAAPADGGSEITSSAATEAPLTEFSDAATAVTGDDPVRAVTELLIQRSVCLDSASVMCLDSVDQAGSPAMATDRALLMHIKQGEQTESAETRGWGDAALVERTGNMALLSVLPAEPTGDSKPASVLVVKGEAGWRLREIFTL